MNVTIIPDLSLKFDFARTMASLEEGLCVSSIMSHPLKTIAADDDPYAFFDMYGYFGFDCAPVASNGHVIGMVYLSDLKHQSSNDRDIKARKLMRSLDQIPLVSGHETVTRLIRKMHETREHFWLVLNGTEINAIVTRSDLWRMPVRLLAIARILYLEQVLAECINKLYPKAQWLELITPERRLKINELMMQSVKRNEQLDPIENTYFPDKLEILALSPELKSYTKKLGGIIHLRNNLMHGKVGEDNESGIDKFLDRFHKLDCAIEFFQQKLMELPSR